MKLTRVETAMSGKIAKWLKRSLGRRTAALSFKQAQREWEIALDTVQELIFIHDADLCIVRANRAYAACAGKDPRDIIGKPYWRLFPKLDGPLPGCRCSLEERQSGEEALHLDSGEEYLSRTYPIFDAEGKYLYSLHVMQDVTAKRKAEAEQRTLSEALRESESKLRVIMESVQTGIVIIDPDSHKIVDVNSTAASMIGAPKEEIVGSACHRFICPAEKGKCPITDFHQIVDHSERVLLTATGEKRPIIKSVTTVTLGGKVHLLESYIDITERKLMEERLHASLAEKETLVQKLNELAARDGLTGLYNRRAFNALLADEFSRAQRSNRPVSLLMLDIDYFKRVNDTHGHLAGDAVLNGLSELLAKQARAIDRVCRYGGEEITVILPETDADTAIDAAERLRAAVKAQLFDVDDGASLRITVSIGVASFPAHADSAQALVAAADAALYAAKQGGRNRIMRYEPAAS